MSWGERSCTRRLCKPEKCTMFTCNVDCEEYEHDGITKPDSTSSRRFSNSRCRDCIDCKKNEVITGWIVHECTNRYRPHNLFVCTEEFYANTRPFWCPRDEATP